MLCSTVCGRGEIGRTGGWWGSGANLNGPEAVVDGGHRAIKYTKLGGVKKEIYAEGTNYPQESLARTVG